MYIRNRRPNRILHRKPISLYAIRILYWKLKLIEIEIGKLDTYNRAAVIND